MPITVPSNLFLSDLTKKEEGALKEYKNAFMPGKQSSPCFDLNRELRNGVRGDELKPDQKSVYDSLECVFERCPRLSKELTVYRCVGTTAGIPVYEIGQRFRNLQYWSTSVCRCSAENFLKPDNGSCYGLLLEIKLPAGFCAYNMETLNGSGGSEKELLLNRGTLWKVENTFKLENVPQQANKFNNVVHTILEPVDS